MFSIRTLAAPFAVIALLLIVGLLISTTVQGQPADVYLWRLAYAFMGAGAALVILATWPGPAPQESRGVNAIPDFGDTAQHLDKMGYLAETEAASTAPAPTLRGFTPRAWPSSK